MKERILEFLKKENKTAVQFAAEIGVQPSSISHILSGRNKPSLDFVIKMLDKYNYLSPEWLLFGKGNMIREEIKSEVFIKDMGLFDYEDKKPVNAPKNEAQMKRDTEINEKSEKKAAQRIIIIYKDNTFNEYFPEL